jgi:uncharacterized Tic20 family protein
MKPKNRKEILDTLQNNFMNYSTFSKIMIVISVVLSALLIALYISRYIIPTIQGIVYEEIVGWNIIWRICLAVILYYTLKILNLICVCIGGSIMCNEEKWESIDFAKAWTNIYKLENYIEKEENSEK